MKAASLSLNVVLFTALPAATPLLDLCPKLRRSQGYVLCDV